MDPRTRTVSAEFDGSRWELAEREVRLALRPQVRGLVGFDERTAGPRSRRQLPGTCVVLILELGAPMQVTLAGERQPPHAHRGGYAVGLRDSFAATCHAGHQRGIQMDLSPTGARRFLGLPLVELGDSVVPLADLVPEVAAALPEQLEELPTWDTRLKLVESLLARRILSSDVDTRRVDWALDRILRTGGQVPIAELARELGHSRKHLSQLFRDQVGVPPKLVAQLVRLERVLAQARADASSSWTELALANGYSDQAHLTREVRRFTGLTPRGLRASGALAADFGG